MNKLTRWMNKQVSARIKTAATGGNLEETLTALSNEYSDLFKAAAPSMFMPMVDGVVKSTDKWFPSVEPTPETMNTFDTAIRENMESVTRIPQEHIERIRKAVRDNPGDTQKLVAELSEVGGRTLRQVKRDATGLTKSLYQKVAVEKAKATGATKGEWLHSHGAKNPRHQHELANGEEFDLNTGIFLTGPLKGKGAGMTDKDNKPVLPGQAYGCGCTFRLIIDFGVQ